MGRRLSCAAWMRSIRCRGRSMISNGAKDLLFPAPFRSVPLCIDIDKLNNVVQSDGSPTPHEFVPVLIIHVLQRHNGTGGADDHRTNIEDVDRGVIAETCPKRPKGLFVHLAEQVVRGHETTIASSKTLDERKFVTAHSPLLPQSID